MARRWPESDRGLGAPGPASSAPRLRLQLVHCMLEHEMPPDGAAALLEAARAAAAAAALEAEPDGSSAAVWSAVNAANEALADGSWRGGGGGGDGLDARGGGCGGASAARGGEEAEEAALKARDWARLGEMSARLARW